jgi:hypothetical protein
MPKRYPTQKEIEQAGTDLFNYAIDREDVKYLVALLPKEAAVTPSKVEYELQLLKIITVGWSISYFLETSAVKPALLERYWQAVQQFALNLSDTTGRMIGQPVDYFAVVKERLDTYVAALAAQPAAPEPARVIGPEFAKACGRREDLFAFMTGSKMFFSTAARVKQYLGALDFTIER